VVSIFSRVSAVGVKVDKKARRRIARRASRLLAPTPRFNVSKAVKAQLQNRALVKFIPKELLKKALAARPNQFVATEPTPPVRQNADVQPLFTHLGMGTNPSLPDLATLRVPTYDLQDFEKDARSVHRAVQPGCQAHLDRDRSADRPGKFHMVANHRLGWRHGVERLRQN